MVTLYDRVFRLVRDEYVEPVAADKLTHGSLEAMLAALDDPRSQFLRPEQREQFARALNGEIQGIGAVLTVVRSARPPCASATRPPRWSRTCCRWSPSRPTRPPKKQG
jgi:C-terminal processing protease CtpA/Prc